MHPALLGLVTIVIGVGACIGYFYFSNLFLDKVLFPGKGPNAGRNINRANQVRPWLFLAPAVFALGLYLGYPVIETLRLSLTDRSQDGAFVGFANYQQMLAEPKFWEAMRNNMLWLIVVPAASTAFGLLAAQLTDRIAWGNLAKSLVFMPMAISFVGASVIFKLIYDTRPEDKAQIGLLNAIWVQFEGGAMSVLFLQVFPIVIVFIFAALVAYAGYIIFRPALAGRKRHLGPGRARRIRRLGTVLDLALARVDSRHRHGRTSLWRAEGLAHGSLLQQLFPDGRADMDPDGVRHGDPIGRLARHPGGHH